MSRRWWIVLVGALACHDGEVAPKPAAAPIEEEPAPAKVAEVKKAEAKPEPVREPEPPPPLKPSAPEAIDMGRQLHAEAFAADYATLEDLEAPLPASVPSLRGEKVPIDSGWTLDTGADDPTHGPGLDRGDTIVPYDEVGEKMRAGSPRRRSRIVRA